MTARQPIAYDTFVELAAADPDRRRRVPARAPADACHVS